jgi:UDP-N-acetylmuramate-alanine ligase
MKETEKVLKQLNKFILNHVEDYDSVDEAVEAFTKLSNEASAKGETFVIGEMTNEEKATEELEKSWSSRLPNANTQRFWSVP